MPALFSSRQEAEAELFVIGEHLAGQKKASGQGSVPVVPPRNRVHDAELFAF